MGVLSLYKRRVDVQCIIVPEIQGSFEVKTTFHKNDFFISLSANIQPEYRGFEVWINCSQIHGRKKNAMKRVATGAHLPTAWLFEPSERQDDRADYCLQIHDLTIFKASMRLASS